MNRFTVKIGDHHFDIHTSSDQVVEWFAGAYQMVTSTQASQVSDVEVQVEAGYGSPFIDHQYTATRMDCRIIYERRDYRLVMTEDCTLAMLGVNNAFSLRHAMMNLYSTWIVHANWGLLLHASCAVDTSDGNAILFSGRSGAGKSTAARLSAPRTLLSDEAAIVRIKDGRADVFDSPFRSETALSGFTEPRMVKAIHLLVQSSEISSRRLHSSRAMLYMMDKLFYWSFEGDERRQVMRLQTELLLAVPVYVLEFQKNSRFWEVI